MAFNHRRLILYSSISDLCEDYCNTSNEDGKCPLSCISLCYPICRQPLDPPPSPKHHLSKPFIISLAIFATAFSLFFAFAIYRFYKAWNSSRRRRSQPQTDLEETTHDQFLDEDHGPFVDHPIWYIRTIGLQPSIINAITVCKYKSGEGLVEGTECSVCLSEFEEDETLRLLPKCNHAFHIPCIDTWLRSHTNCPMCRAGIVAGVTASPSPEPNLDHPDVGEETTPVGNSEDSTELEREREVSTCELRIGIEEESDENGISKEEVGSSESSDHIPMRRSVSLDSLSASMISLAVNNCIPTQSAENSNTQLVKLKESNLGIVPKRVDVNKSLLRLVGSSSIGRSLQKGPISMKRSLSCSGKVLLSRFSRSRNSVLPS